MLLRTAENYMYADLYNASKILNLPPETTSEVLN